MQGSEFLLEGVLYDPTSLNSRYAYDEEISVSEPALERCSEICKSRNVKHQYSAKINRLTAANISVLNCQMFSYSLTNATCWIKYNAGRQQFRAVEKCTTFDGLSVTGDFNILKMKAFYKVTFFEVMFVSCA